MSKVLILGIEQAIEINFAQRLKRLGHTVMVLTDEPKMIEFLQPLQLECYLGTPSQPEILLSVLSICQVLYVFPPSDRWVIEQKSRILHHKESIEAYAEIKASSASAHTFPISSPIASESASHLDSDSDSDLDSASNSN